MSDRNPAQAVESDAGKATQGGKCDNCGSEETVPVWNTPAKFRKGMTPDYVGCADCNEMERTETWGDD